MQVTTLSLLATVLLASSAAAGKNRRHRRSSYSSDESSSSASSSTSVSSESVEDFSINSCNHEDDTAVIIEGLSNTASILKKVGNKYPVTFFATIRDIQRYAYTVNKIHEERLNKVIGWKVDGEIEKELFKLAKKEGSAEKLEKRVKKYKKQFKVASGSKLQFAMFSSEAPERVVDAFTKNELIVVSSPLALSKAKDITRSIKKKHQSGNIVHFDSRKITGSDVYEAIKALKKKRKHSVVTLRECLLAPLTDKSRKGSEESVDTNQVATNNLDGKSKRQNIRRNLKLSTHQNDDSSTEDSHPHQQQQQQQNPDVTDPQKMNAVLNPNGGQQPDNQVNQNKPTDNTTTSNNNQSGNTTGNSATSINVSAILVTVSSVLAAAALLI